MAEAARRADDRDLGSVEISRLIREQQRAATSSDASKSRDSSPQRWPLPRIARRPYRQSQSLAFEHSHPAVEQRYHIPRISLRGGIGAMRVSPERFAATPYYGRARLSADDDREAR